MVPFVGLEERDIKIMLTENKLRPKIPESTDKSLSLLIRRCW